MNEIHETIKEVLSKLLGFMSLEHQVDLSEQTVQGSQTIFVSVNMPSESSLIIGKNGQNLKSLEHLLRIMVAKKHVGPLPSVILDINDYRKARSQHLIELTRQTVNRVRNTQKAEALAPMSSYERRVVHMELASCPDIATESIGEEPQRRVVIKPFKI